MFRRSAFERAGGYRPEAEYWEDLDLYLRMAELGRVLVVPEVLGSVRFTAASARLTNDARRVDEALDLMYRSVEDYARGGDYPRRFPPRAGPDDKLVPETFVGRGSVQLWSGRSPGLFVRMLKNADLGFDWKSLQVLIWASWATVSPKSLRLTLRLLARWRRMRIAPQVGTSEAVEWKPARARRAAATNDAPAQLAADLSP